MTHLPVQVKLNLETVVMKRAKTADLGDGSALGDFAFPDQSYPGHFFLVISVLLELLITMFT